MTKVSAIRQFATLVAGEKVIICRDSTEWESPMWDQHFRLGLPKNLTIIDEQDKLFRRDFVRRCPLAQGFSHVTLSVLHELGHQFHREEYIYFPAKEYEEAKGEDHFQLFPEVVATNWAIEWLQDPEHRKLAKAFERKFFGY